MSRKRKIIRVVLAATLAVVYAGNAIVWWLNDESAGWFVASAIIATAWVFLGVQDFNNLRHMDDDDKKEELLA